MHEGNPLPATESAANRAKKRRLKTLPILIVGVLLIVMSLAALFSLSGKAVKFDTAFDKGGDLSPFFFEKLEEGQNYTAMQSLILNIARRRVWIALAGILIGAVYVVINRELLYSRKVAPYVFIAPFIITFLVFFLNPFFSTILMSFQSIKGSGSEWIGLANYTRIFSNKTFYTAVQNSTIYMVLTCALLIPFPLLFAYMLNSIKGRVSTVFKMTLFLPVLCSVVVAGIVFRMLFSELPGSLMNKLLVSLGGQPIPWLKYNRWTAMFAMVLLCCWRWTGMNILYYMAGLQSIPRELYESAEIDGANSVQKFLHIGWPLLKPTTVYVLTISIYAGLSMFTESMMIFGGNNSPKNYGLTIVGYLYRYGFEKVDKFGYASAVGLVLLAGAMLITVVQLYLTGTIGKKKEA